MNAQKYRQLSEVHLLHRIWQNELKLALQEITFWETLLAVLGEEMDPAVTNPDTWRQEIDQLHHFRRLSKRLLGEIAAVNEQIATGVRFGHVLDSETRLDHQYLRDSMDSFHADFRSFKTEIRQFMVAQPTF